MTPSGVYTIESWTIGGFRHPPLCSWKSVYKFWLSYSLSFASADSNMFRWEQDFQCAVGKTWSELKDTVLEPQSVESLSMWNLWIWRADYSSESIYMSAGPRRSNLSCSRGNCISIPGIRNEHFVINNCSDLGDRSLRDSKWDPLLSGVTDYT